jgi:hypothetical protein
MRKVILAIICFIAISTGYSQGKNEAYYLRTSEQFTAAGRLHSYEIMHFSDSNVELIIIEVQGKIGNPLITDFFIDKCLKYVGKMDNLNSGYLAINDEAKRKLKVKKRSARKLIVDLQGVVIKYNRISETVNFLVKLESYCFCKPIVPTDSR